MASGITRTSLIFLIYFNSSSGDFKQYSASLSWSNLLDGHALIDSVMSLFSVSNFDGTPIYNLSHSLTNLLRSWGPLVTWCKYTNLGLVSRALRRLRRSSYEPPCQLCLDNAGLVCLRASWRQAVKPVRMLFGFFLCSSS